MRRLVLLLALVGTGACHHFGFQKKPKEPSVESMYLLALHHLDPANEQRSVLSAVANLDAYLSVEPKPRHHREATILRTLAGQAQRLHHVETELRTALARANADARADAGAEPRPRPEARTESRASEEAVKEIQRLREELKAANAELERIRKRLTTPKP